MATGSDKHIAFSLDATDNTKRALTTATSNIKKTSKEADGLALKFRSVARATVLMEGPLGGTAGRLSAVATMLNSVSLTTIAAGVGFAGLTTLVYQSFKAFAQYEQQTLKIDSLIKQTGGSAGVTGDEIEAMSRRIGKATLSSTDDVRGASAVLLSFRSVAGSAFSRTMTVASDLAAVTGQDLKQSVIQLGKALEDPATGMSALRRSGVSFTNAQKDMIVAMKASGDTAGAQAAILKLLEGQLGGTGAAAGGGLAGAADLVAENWTYMLEQFANSGPGKLATEVLTGLGNSLEWVGYLMKDDNDVQKQRFKLMDKIAEKTRELTQVNAIKNKNAGDIRNLQLLAQERHELIQMKEAIEQKAQAEIAAARKKGAVAQEEIRKEENADKAADDAKKKRAEELKQFEKDKKDAGSYAQKLADENEKYRISLLEKSQQEDQFYADKLLKIQAFNAQGLLDDQTAEEAGLQAKYLYEAKKGEIERAEKDKLDRATEKRRKDEVAATEAALGDIAGLMAASSKKLFALGKGAAIANALINTYQAVTKTMSSVPYPFNIPLAVAQGVAGMVQVQKIKSQTMAAKEHGGSVIGGRQYLVGERGPELFTPPRTGQIINNSSTTSMQGATNNINVTVVNELGDQFIERNTVKIWDSILRKMNEEGLRFA